MDNDFRNIKLIIVIIIWMFILSVIYTLVTGCTKTIKNVVEVHDTTYVTQHHTDTLLQTIVKTDTIKSSRTDTIHEFKVVRDSLVVRDSIFVKEKGDTIYIYKERWNTHYLNNDNTNNKILHDTIWSHSHDTIYLYRSITDADTTNHTSISNHEVVKQKKSWTWLKISGWLIGIFGIAFGIWWILQKVKK